MDRTNTDPVQLYHVSIIIYGTTLQGGFLIGMLDKTVFKKYSKVGARTPISWKTNVLFTVELTICKGDWWPLTTSLGFLQVGTHANCWCKHWEIRLIMNSQNKRVYLEKFLVFLNPLNNKFNLIHPDVSLTKLPIPIIDQHPSAQLDSPQIVPHSRSKRIIENNALQCGALKLLNIWI